MNRRILIFIMIVALPAGVNAQYFPDPGWNMPLPMLYGKDVPATLGDPDHIMDIFFLVPENYNSKVFFRVYDPGVEGEHDEVRDQTSVFQYTVLGGKRCLSVDDHYSGTVLAKKTFGSMGEYDMTHETIGSFDVHQGEYMSDYKSYLFKVVIEGLAGFSGNSFRLEVSGRDDYLDAIEGARAFCYDYTFSMYDDPDEVSHIYPWVTDKTEKIILSTYDMEKDGAIRISSPVRKGENLKASGDDEWLKNKIKVLPGEKGAPMDIQIIKSKKSQIENNVITIRILDQDRKPLLTEPWSISKYDLVE